MVSLSFNHSDVTVSKPISDISQEINRRKEVSSYGILNFYLDSRISISHSMKRVEEFFCFFYAIRKNLYVQLMLSRLGLFVALRKWQYCLVLEIAGIEYGISNYQSRLFNYLFEAKTFNIKICILGSKICKFGLTVKLCP